MKVFNIRSVNIKLTFIMIAIALSGCGGGGGDDSEGPDPDIFSPEIVEGFMVVDRSKTAIVLGWTRGNSFVDSYNIYRDGAFIANVDNDKDNFLDNELMEDTAYSYQISSQQEVFDNIEESNLSEVIVTSTLAVATTVPLAPINLLPSNRKANSIRIGWDDISTNEEGYNIYRDGVLIETVPFTERSFSHTSSSLTFDTDYDFTVKAFNDAGESLPLDATFTTRHEAVAPTAPTGVMVSSATTDSVTLGFTDNANNEDGYMIFEGTNSNPSEICRGENINECTIAGLTAATTYNFQLAAFVITEESGLTLFFIPSDKVSISASTL